MTPIYALVAVLAVADLVVAYAWWQERQRHAETKREQQYARAALRYWRGRP